MKRRSFTVIPMPDRIITRVNMIGKRKGQGRDFRFVDRRREPYSWTDEVPEDDTEFQGLLEEEEAVYPDIAAELPGVELEVEQTDVAPVLDDPKVNFCELADAALRSTGINPEDWLRAARQAGANTTDNKRGPAIVEADNDGN